MKRIDQCQRFLFEEHSICGQHVSLGKSWQEISQQRELEGKGPMELLVVEANSTHSIRGAVRQSGKIDETMDQQQIFGSDYLVITIKSEGAEPHQGIAPL